MASVTAAVRAIARVVAPIKYRLLLINVIVAAVPLVGIAFARFYEQQLLAALESDLIHQAELVRAVVVAQSDLNGHVLAAAARDTRTRIRLLDATGTVTADSHAGGPPEGAELPVPYLAGGAAPTHAPRKPDPLDVRDRPEVRAALAGRYGSATRLWSKQERVYLFAALPILRDGGITGVVYVTRSTHDVKLQLFRLRAWLAQLLLATVVLTALITLLLATTIARPIARLTRRAQRIAARQPVEPDRLAQRHDEIGELARAVAVMTAELERRARDARTLAADISHEFKTPLTGIRGAAELLRDGAAEAPDTRERFLAMIVEDAARLDRLVSRLLELARVDDDHGTALPVDLAELARACAARSWRVPVMVSSEPAIVSGRSAALAAAIDNLVANATEHADPDTRVMVAITRRRDVVRVTVANRGAPPSSAARLRLWDRFYTTRAGQGGTGLGLAIVRSVATAHGGNVGLRCEARRTELWFEVRARVG